MALIWLSYPIAGATGNFATTEFATTKNGIELRPRKPSRNKYKKAKIPPSDPPCKNFKKADEIYQSFTPAEKDVWRKAAKKPHMSPYDIFMSECLTCFNTGRNAPVTPSISGGYSTSKVLCDGPIPPP